MYAGTNIIDRLSGLSKEKQLLFGLLAAERFFICYKIFNRREGFGNVVHLLETMSLIERVILGEKTNVELVNQYKGLVDESTPNMDDFGSVNSSLALNVSAIIYEGLNLVLKNERRILNNFSAFCKDSIDFLVLEIENYDRMELDKVLSNPLMKEELQIQNGIVSYLEKIGKVETRDIDSLRQMQSETLFCKLNFEQIFAE